MLSKAANFLVFQITWWASVLGAASSILWLGPAVAAVALCLHIFLVPDRLAALKLIAFMGLLGYITDSALGLVGVFEFREHALDILWLAPVWLLGLWLVFATTFRSSLEWLSDHSRLAAMLGGVAGPLSYYAGDRLGALRIGEPLIQKLIILALVWSLLLPILFACSRGVRHNR